MGASHRHAFARTAMFGRLFAVLTMLVYASGASAQNPQAREKIETKFFVETAGADPIYCGLEFTIVFRDYVRQEGALSRIDGSLAWGMEGMLLKINGGDVSPSLVRFEVLNGFLVLDGQPIKPIATLPCEKELGYCGIYSIQPSMSVFSALMNEQLLSVGFQRAQGGLVLDVVLPIKLSPESIISDNSNAFLACMTSLARR